MEISFRWAGVLFIANWLYHLRAARALDGDSRRMPLDREEREPPPPCTPSGTPTAAPALTTSMGATPGCAACLALAPCLPPWADPHHAAPRCAVLQEMTCRGCERSVITYSSLISACEKAGQWELALEFFQEMVGGTFGDLKIVNYLRNLALDWVVGVHVALEFFQQTVCGIFTPPGSLLGPRDHFVFVVDRSAC